MNQYTAVIIDDEPKLREVLCLKVKKNFPFITEAGQAGDASDGFEVIMKKKPDIVFLDISMPGESGFDMLDRFEQITFEIIFVTGYNDYAIDALQVSAVDYLLKPVKTEDLARAIERAIHRITNKDKIERYEALKHNKDKSGDQSSKIAIPGVDSYDFVTISDIIRCEGWQKYTKIFLSNGENLLSSYHIGVFKKILEKYGFFSTHKSHLINTTHIVNYKKDGTLTMKDRSVVPVARRRKDDFLQLVLHP
jgi:two-component system LytT family response regulator